MFLVDDVLFSPVTGLLHIFRELHQVVQQDAVNEAEAIRTELSELYMLLETSQISEAEADVQEQELLDRLEEIETRGSNSHEDEDESEKPTGEPDASALAEGPEPSEEDRL